MNNYFKAIFIFYFTFSMAGLQDWIPGWKNTAATVEPSKKSIADVFKDRQLRQECFKQQESLAQQGQYWNLQTSCDLYKDMLKNSENVKQINAYLAEVKSDAEKKMAAERKLQQLDNQRFKKIAAYTAVFGGSASISGLILKALVGPRSMVYTGLATRFGFGAFTGFGIGTWRLAKIEQENKQILEDLKNKRSV